MFLFFRGYLESFSTVIKTPRTSVSNIISKIDVSNENSESYNIELNDSVTMNENVESHDRIKESCVELKNEV